MRKNGKKALLLLMLILTGCGRNHKETDAKVIELELDALAEELEATAMIETEELTKFESVPDGVELEPSDEVDLEISDPELLLDAFLANQIPAVDDEQQKSFMSDNFQNDDGDWDAYSVGERVDLDNDGEEEQVINGPYGGLYLDARNQKVYILARGEGTSGELSYVQYDNAVWIVHRDVTHAGRQMFWLTRYDGNGQIADEIQLSAEYWESPDYHYHEDSDFTFGDNKISMEEYEKLRKEIFGW